jgi:hypothetical protein
MPDRLSHLVRQRALLQEHLAWLDREIANATQEARPGSVAAADPVAVGTDPGAVPSPLPRDLRHGDVASRSEAPVAVVADADAILAQYRVPPGTTAQNVRKGCFLYLAAALALLAVGVTLAYFVLRSP